MEQIVLLIHVLAALSLIGFILVQHGKGAEVGASFGSGASQTFFGSQGSGGFLTRATAILVTVFFLSSLTLGYLSIRANKTRDLDDIVKSVAAEAPSKADNPRAGNASAEDKNEDDIPTVSHEE